MRFQEKETRLWKLEYISCNTLKKHLNIWWKTTNFIFIFFRRWFGLAFIFNCLFRVFAIWVISLSHLLIFVFYSRDKTDKHFWSKNKKTIPSIKRSVLHFIGYFYCYFCCKYEIPSIRVRKEISFEYLLEKYDVLHSFDVNKACGVVNEVFSISRD